LFTADHKMKTIQLCNRYW